MGEALNHMPETGLNIPIDNGDNELEVKIVDNDFESKYDLTPLEELRASNLVTVQNELEKLQKLLLNGDKNDEEVIQIRYNAVKAVSEEKARQEDVGGKIDLL